MLESIAPSISASGAHHSSYLCRAARFKGFQQQDSQELLRYLLDGMRAEEHNVCTGFETDLPIFKSYRVLLK